MPLRQRFLDGVLPVKNLWRAKILTFSSRVMRMYRKKDFSVLCPVISIIRNAIIPAKYIFVAALRLAVCEDMNLYLKHSCNPYVSVLALI